MADLILEVVRTGGARRPHSHEQMVRVAARLKPDNITPRPPVVTVSRDAVTVTVNPSEEGVLSAGNSALLGGVIGAAGRWWEVGTEPPDGTYVLARCSGDTVELISDMTASRTLWYVEEGDRLLASTSQRALVCLLGDLDLDRAAIAWMVTAGSLGPGRAWDARIRRLPGDSRLVLDRRRWRTTLDRRPVVFEPGKRSRGENVELLRDAIAWSCENLDVDIERWALPLSGGMDSRMILVFLTKSGRSPRCITWTTRQSRRNPLSDAFLSGVLAHRYHAQHEYAYLDGDRKADFKALQRFVEAAEGRTDEFAGYVDGLGVWASLFDRGFSGVLRGDDPLGARRRAISDDASRRLAGCTMAGDYPHGHLVHRLGLAEQEWPEWYHRREGEGNEAYRDRLSHEGYITNVLAPLTGLKCRYIEVVNPLLSRRILTVVRSFPDELRMYGRAFSAIVDPETRPIPHARFSSTPAASVFLGHEEIVEAIIRELTSPEFTEVMSEEAATTLLAAVASPTHTPPSVRDRVTGVLRKARVAMPSTLAYRYTPRFEGPLPLPPIRMAFRSTVASRTIALLRDDARLLAGDAG